MGDDLQQGPRGVGLDVAGECGLVAIARGHDQRATGACRGDRRRQDAVHGAQFAGQGEFAEEFAAAQRVHADVAIGREDAQRDRQIEAPAILGQVGRREVDDHASLRHLELRALDRGANTIAALAHRGRRQADDLHLRQAGER